MNKKIVAVVTAAAVLAGFSTSAMAAREAGDWIFRVGMTNVDPKQGNGEVDGLNVDIDDDTQLSLTGTWMMTQSLGLELLASLPFEHDIYIESIAGIAGSTQHLPPTLNLQWHFNPQGEFHPYLGAGINYTTFFGTEWSDTTVSAVDGIAGNPDPSITSGDIKLEDSFGYDIQAGVDFEISERLLLNLDVRYIKIESDLKVRGTKVETVKIDPITVGVSLGWKF